MKKIFAFLAAAFMFLSPLTVLADSPDTKKNGGGYKDNTVIDPCNVTNPALGAKGCRYYVNNEWVEANGDQTITVLSSGNIFDANGRLIGNVKTGKYGQTTEAYQKLADKYTFKFEKEFRLFAGVYVDNTFVESKWYDAYSGSTYVKLKQAYIDTLAEGTHTLTAVFTDGSSYSEKFTVYRQKTGVPNTGDRNYTPYLVMLGGALVVIAGAGYILTSNR